MPSDPPSSDSSWGLFGGGIRPGKTPEPGAGDAAELDFDSDMETHGHVPTRPQRRLVAKPAQANAVAAALTSETAMDAVAEEGSPETKGTGARRAPLEKKSKEGIKPFTRFVTRPGASVAATVAADQSSSENFISPETSGSVPVFGKIRNQKEVELRPSRLHHVLLEAWTHSRLGWLDQLGRIKNAVLACLVAAISAVILWPYLKEVLRDRGFGVVSMAPEALLAPDSVRQAAIRQAFETYRNASGIAEKVRWVLEPQRVESRMKDFYQVQGQLDPTIASFDVGPPVRAGAGWWFVITGTTTAGQGISALMKETPDGGQLDWENFVAYGSMPWGKFIKEHPSAPQAMRARIRRSSQFSGKYSSEDYLAFEVAHRNSPEVLQGYALKSSRSGQALELEPGLEQWQPVNLYLSWEADAGSPDAVLIGDLIRNNWLDGLGGNPPANVAGPTAVKPSVVPPSPP